jgi:TonB family protein
MLKRTRTILGGLAILAASGAISAQTALTAKNNNFKPQPVSKVVESDRMRDGLIGPVRRVRTEIVKLSSEGGRVIEGKRALLEVVSYDVKGNKVENQYFPVEGANLTGKEVYKYDDKGNISEMTLVNDDGSLLSKETYKYEFDFAGNWNKMTTSVAVVDTGKVSFEPSEVTYRSIMYYLDENMVKMVQPSAPTASLPAPPVAPAKTSAGANSVAAQPKRSGNNKKTRPNLPISDVELEKVSAVNSVEVKTVSSNGEARVPQIFIDTEPPPTPGPKPILKPVSGGVLNGAALSLPAPIYPDAAKRMRLSGTIVVEVVIDEMGKVISARAQAGPGALRDAAVQAALRARFSPTKLSGQPVKVSGIINYKFSLT